MPAAERYFEHYVPGSVYSYGPIEVREEDVLRFAREFDPQPIHTDPAWAAGGPFGGLIASGWHTASLMMRLLVDHYLPTVAGLASPGVDELRWLRPVRPGDRLWLRVEVLDARPSRSKPDRGLVRSGIAVLNADDDAVMTMSAMTMMRRSRPGVEATRPEPAG